MSDTGARPQRDPVREQVEIRSSRLGAFVQAARSLLVMQVLAAVLALGVAVWALVEVQGLAAERNQLRGRVTELEAQRAVQPDLPPPPGTLPPAPLPPPEPLFNVVDPGFAPTILTPPPVLTPPANTVAPLEPAGIEPIEPVEEGGPPRRDPTPPRRDCSGVNADRPGCRRILERPEIAPVPDRLTPRGERLGEPTREPR